ncbi:MAG: hypothetical protein OEW75_13755, partial [Cyclobacteriaceae bacterium]|nr:hypothetical protein [Cyclobacteriaceae bacterium]
MARIFLLLLVVTPQWVFSQAQFNVQLQNYSLHPDTYSFRLSTSGGSTGYYDMTSWESSPYTQGHMNYFQNFRMNYRLLYPGGYNVNYAPGYPLILMVHGAGERGNCWSTSCWFATNKWNPITNDPQAGPTTNPRLLNNDHNLIHGGRPHLDAVNLAGSKLPNDPTLDSRAFPGFVLFPQCLNNWNGGQIEDVLRLVYLLMNDPAINIDPNRIYVHGLSLGAENIITALKRDPSLFACAALMSPSNSDTKVRNDTTISNVPLWVFQGGRDSNPSPNKTQNLKRWFEELGGSVRYTLYPNLGHGTWNTAYAEPDFFTWFLEKRRNNLFVYYGDSTLCSTNNKGVKLGMPHDTRYRKGDGTLANNVNDIDAYQWEKDG